MSRQLTFLISIVFFIINFVSAASADDVKRDPASYKAPKMQKTSEKLAPPPAVSTDEAPSGEEDDFG